jgi:HD-GYP domain-containing protein (c-di-GMP phosphodiesterase class II)
VIADAIDAKSPYTGGHCARVPEIAKLLAAAACESAHGPFAGFQLVANGWEALHGAAWLHDCGKETTPGHVVDKATTKPSMAAVTPVACTATKGGCWPG